MLELELKKAPTMLAYDIYCNGVFVERVLGAKVKADAALAQYKKQVGLC